MDSVVHSTMKPPVIIIYLVLVPSAQIYLKLHDILLRGAKIDDDAKRKTTK